MAKKKSAKKSAPMGQAPCDFIVPRVYTDAEVAAAEAELLEAYKLKGKADGLYGLMREKLNKVGPVLGGGYEIFRKRGRPIRLVDNFSGERAPRKIVYFDQYAVEGGDR